MDDYAGRVLADRYRLPLSSDDAYETVDTRAFDTYSGQEVLVHQVPLPEVVDAEVLGADEPVPASRRAVGRDIDGPADPAVRRAVEAARAAAQVPDHPRLDQVFDVFAEAGSLWIVSELVAARPLAALLAERPLNPFRAAEIGSDVLAALRVLHAHGWTHRNITLRTVLVCDDGRVVLTGLAAGAAEEALCGYVSTPPAEDDEDDEDEAYGDGFGIGRDDGFDAGRGDGFSVERGDGFDVGRGFGRPAPDPGPAGIFAPPPPPFLPPAPPAPAEMPAPRGPAAIEPSRPHTGDGAHGDGTYGEDAYGEDAHGGGGAPDGGAPDGDAAPTRAGHSGAIAAYRAGALAAARVSEDRRRAGAQDAGTLPVQRSARPVDADRTDQFRKISAGGSTALPVQRPAPRPVQPERAERASGWDEGETGGRTGSGYRGPATPLAAERARQARIAVVGPVTERWAPEQGGPVHENWRLAPPIGPATDLWALGALLYRAVQGHAPYPEESAAELVQMVCGEPPAFAEECGPLRPVVESLLRQDPTERPDVEELSGWLRSLVRSAPEPEAGLDVVPLPSADTGRLPIVRRRGELVRKRRGKGAAHGRHRHARGRAERQDTPLTELFDQPDRPAEPPRQARPPRPAREPREPRPPKALRTPPRPGDGERSSPRRLGRLLLVLILLALLAAVAYAVVFLPKAGESGDGGTGPAASSSGTPRPGAGEPDGQASPDSPGEQQPQTSRSAVALASGYTLRKDSEGFEVGVLKSWQRTPANADRQIRYGSGGFSLLIVPGRDTVESAGNDPLAYQADKERELQQFRDSSWSGSSGLRRIDVGRQAMAEGQFTWRDAAGRSVYARNLVMVVKGRYHVIQVIGPQDERARVSEIYEQAISSYRVTR
ncbi:serine/threonine protein kinase [Streptomyces sp. NPDC058195]|uniref:serine/threonine protein kinase n=1 Tax=Streptomyces sp. NPDC058195 TaxID=3346375 RepID=UPI0036E84761